MAKQDDAREVLWQDRRTGTITQASSTYIMANMDWSKDRLCVIPNCTIVKSESLSRIPKKGERVMLILALIVMPGDD